MYGPPGGSTHTVEIDQFATVCCATAFAAKTRRRATCLVAAGLVAVAGMSTSSTMSTMAKLPTTAEFNWMPPSVETTTPAVESLTITFSDRSGTSVSVPVARTKFDDDAMPAP